MPVPVFVLTIIKQDFSEMHHLTLAEGVIVWICSCMPEEEERIKIEKEAMERLKKMQEEAKKPLIYIPPSEYGAN